MPVRADGAGRRQFWSWKTRPANSAAPAFIAVYASYVAYLEMRAGGSGALSYSLVGLVAVIVAFRGIRMKIEVENGEVFCLNQFWSHRIPLASLNRFEVRGNSVYYVVGQLKDGTIVRMPAISSLVPRDRNRHGHIHVVVDELNSVLQRSRQAAGEQT